MKKQIFLITFYAVTCLSTATGNSKISPKDPTVLITQSDEIDLRGRIEPGEIRRDTKAISAFLQENDIKALFYFDMGTVQITITNAIGSIVYSTAVASSIGEILIPTTGLASGNYTITFTAASGVLTGDFVF